MDENAREAAELQRLRSPFDAPLAELRQADAEAADRMAEDVADRDDRWDAPLREVAAQPERVREVFETHPRVVVRQDRAQLDAREVALQRVLDHRPELHRFA